MTKQEVYNNIIYNENLVNQYARDLNCLRTRANALNSQISRLNFQNSQLQSKLKEAKSIISELEQLKSKFKSPQDEFFQRQAVRKSKLVRNFQKSRMLYL